MSNTEATQTGSRAQSAQVMMEQERLVLDMGYGTFRVQSQHGMDRYTVRFEGTSTASAATCECKDFLYRCSSTGTDCKHIILARRGA